MLPKHQYSWCSGQSAPLAMGASAMTQCSKWGPGAVGQDVVAFEPKDNLKLKKKKNLLNFPSACTTHSPCQTLFSCYCISWARGSKDTADLGKGVAEEDGVGEGGYVTTSSHLSHPLELSSLPVFAMAVKVFSLCPTP